MAPRLEDPRFFFTSHGGDHHTFALAHKSLGALFGDEDSSSEITTNQITWQVGTLEEVVRAAEFLKENGVKIERVGRDMPGSNWHVYFLDPDGHTVELYYGIEQVGPIKQKTATEIQNREGAPEKLQIPHHGVRPRARFPGQTDRRREDLHRLSTR